MNSEKFEFGMEIPWQSEVCNSYLKIEKGDRKYE
jgi:hypothetical protein